MGIQINGNTDTISAIDGGLTVSGASLGSASASSLNISGIVTASGFSGNVTGNVNATGLSTFSGGLLVGTGASISSPASNVLTLGTNNTESVRVDSSGNIGINTSTFPANGTNLKVSNGTISRILLDKTGTNSRSFSIGNGGTYLNVYDETADAERLRIDSSGRVTTPSQPRAHITKTTGNTLTSSASKITFDAATYDIGSNYSDANDRYTAPVTGYYLVSSNINVINTTNNVTVSVYKNGAVYGNMRYSCTAANVRLNYILVGVVYLSAGDYIEVFGLVNTGTVGVDNDGFLSIALLG